MSSSPVFQFIGEVNSKTSIVFTYLLNTGNLMTSRFTGYPVAEIGLGFLAYNFGSFYTNSSIFDVLNIQGKNKLTIAMTITIYIRLGYN